MSSADPRMPPTMKALQPLQFSLLIPLQSHPNRPPTRTELNCCDWKTENSDSPMVLIRAQKDRRTAGLGSDAPSAAAREAARGTAPTP